MDKDKHPKSVYPDASRGVLANEQIHKTYKSKPLNKVRDYSPQTIIIQAVVISLLIGVLGIGGYIFVYAKTRESAPDVMAFAIARKVSELKTSQHYEDMEHQIGYTLKQCKAPILTVTHEYHTPGQPKRTDKTVIDTKNIRDLTVILDELVTKADGAAFNRLSASCST